MTYETWRDGSNPLLNDAPDVTVLHDKTRKARKRHLCNGSGCGRVIEPGKRYRSVAYIDEDGKFQHYAECFYCECRNRGWEEP